jgi:hypothetical protein
VPLTGAPPHQSQLCLILPATSRLIGVDSEGARGGTGVSPPQPVLKPQPAVNRAERGKKELV